MSSGCTPLARIQIRGFALAYNRQNYHYESRLLYNARKGDTKAAIEYARMNGDLVSYNLQPYGTYIAENGKEVAGSRKIDGYYLVAQQESNGPIITKDRNHWFGETLDIHIESIFKDYDDMTIVNHHVLVVQHTKEGKLTNRHQFAIGTISFPDGSEIWGYGQAKFSESFLKHTQILYEIRQPFHYPQSIIDKYEDFIFSKPKEQKDRLRTGAPHY